MTMIKWIKNKLGITKLEQENQMLKYKLEKYQDFIKEYTRVDADIGYRGNNTIILTGVYRNKAYVHFYDIGDGEFVNLVEHLREMKDHALIRHIDKPPHFSGFFDL